MYKGRQYVTMYTGETTSILQGRDNEYVTMHKVETINMLVTMYKRETSIML